MVSNDTLALILVVAGVFLLIVFAPIYLKRRPAATSQPLLACRDCGASISARAQACPHCGSPNASPVLLSLQLIAGLVLLAIAGLWFWIASRM